MGIDGWIGSGGLVELVEEFERLPLGQLQLLSCVYASIIDL